MRIWTVVVMVGLPFDPEMKPEDDPTDGPFCAVPTLKVVFASSPDDAARKM